MRPYIKHDWKDRVIAFACFLGLIFSIATVFLMGCESSVDNHAQVDVSAQEQDLSISQNSAPTLLAVDVWEPNEIAPEPVDAIPAVITLGDVQELVDSARKMLRQNQTWIETINYNLRFNREVYARMRAQRPETDFACQRLVLEKFFLSENLAVNKALRKAYLKSLRQLLLIHDEVRLRGGDAPSLKDTLKAIKDEFDHARQNCLARLVKARDLLENGADIIPARDLVIISNPDEFMEFKPDVRNQERKER